MKRANFGITTFSGLAALGTLTIAGGVLLGGAPAARAQDVSGKPVTINLQNAPVQTVLRSLFKSAGKNFTIDPTVTGSVTVDVTQVPFDTALSAVLAGTNPPLEAPIVNGIYQVAAARPPQAQPSGPRDNGNSQNNATPSTASDPHHAYRIPINHYDAATMSYLIAAFSQKGGIPIVVPATGIQQSGYGGQGGQGGYGGGQGGYGGGLGGGLGGGIGGFGGGIGGGGLGGGLGGFGGGLGGGGFGGGGLGGGGFGGGGFGGGGGYRGF